MQGKFRVIALCGATQFDKEISKAQKDLTLQGNIVIPIVSFNQFDKSKRIDSYTAVINDEMRREQINMADELFVINVNGYIEYQTKLDIQYAYRNGKIVNYLEPITSDIESIIMQASNNEEKTVLAHALNNFASDIDKRCKTCNRRYACKDHNEFTCIHGNGGDLDKFIQNYKT